MPLDIELPILEHKYIKLYDTQDEYEADKVNYEEVCYSIVKSAEATDNNYSEYQYSIRTTNNDNEVMGKYWDMETIDIYAGLEIIWGYFGWEWIDFEWNGETLKGGNFYVVKPMTVVKSIPDGNRLQHINDFIKNLNHSITIEEFDTSNIKSAQYAFAGISNIVTFNFDISFPKLENASHMFDNNINTKELPVLNLPNLVDASYMFYKAKYVKLRQVIGGNKCKSVAHMYELVYLDISDISYSLEDLFWEGISESCNDYTNAITAKLNNVTLNIHIKNITDDEIKLDKLFYYPSYTAYGESVNNVTINLSCDDGVKLLTGNIINKQYGNLNTIPFNYILNIDDKLIDKYYPSISSFYFLKNPINKVPDVTLNYSGLFNNCKFDNVVFTYTESTTDIELKYIGDLDIFGYRNKKHDINNNDVYDAISCNINVTNETQFDLIGIEYLNIIFFKFTFSSDFEYFLKLKEDKTYNIVIINTNIKSFKTLSVVNTGYLYLHTDKIDYSITPITFKIYNDKTEITLNNRDFIFRCIINSTTVSPKFISNRGLPDIIEGDELLSFDGEECTNINIDTNKIFTTSNIITSFDFSACPKLVNIKIGNNKGTYNFNNCKNLNKDDFINFLNNQTWTKEDNDKYTMSVTRELYNQLSEEEIDKIISLFTALNIQDS